jgi:hypothetical protein
VNPQAFDRKFVVESAAYWYAPKSAAEGHYLTAFLNSGYANALIKPFQSTGLFGPRHVQKKILDVPLPEYNGTNAAHVRLSELGRACAVLAQAAADSLTRPVENLTLGRARLEIRKLLATHLTEADGLLCKLCG